MKILSTFLLLISLRAEAQIDLQFKKGLEAVSGQIKVTPLDCDPSDPTSAAWCKNLFKSTCDVKKSTNKSEALDEHIQGKTYQNLSVLSSPSEIIKAAEKALKMADEMIYSKDFILKKDLVNTFKDTKSMLADLINKETGISKDMKSSIQKKIKKVNLMDGADYVKHLTRYAKQQNSELTKDEARMAALELFMSVCGKTGMESNAFFDGTNMVLCPGLIYSLSDFPLKDKAQALNALSFTIGHEISHSFDANEQPEIYTSMKTCFEKISKIPGVWSKNGSEISADYWGSMVLAQRLKAQNVKGADAVRTISYATEGFCKPGPAVAHDPHPPGDFRINYILARGSVMREALQCNPPSSSLKSCTTNGAVP